MNKLFITFLASLLLTNIAWAHPTETTEPQVSKKVAAIDTNESQRYNSLPRAVLSKQGVKAKFIYVSGNQIDYSRYSPRGGYNHSLFNHALRK